MNGGFRILELIRTWARPGTVAPASAEDLPRRMDRHGIERSVVIPFPVVTDYRREHNLIGKAVNSMRITSWARSSVSARSSSSRSITR